MAEPTRREFLAAAGSVALSTSLAAPKPPPHDERQENRRHADDTDMPPHKPRAIEGVHAYADRISAAAGETIRFHVSSSYPYELQVARLGTDVDSPACDEILHSFGPSPAAVQRIHPGSYLVAVKHLDAETSLAALTLEV